MLAPQRLVQTPWHNSQYVKLGNTLSRRELRGAAAGEGESAEKRGPCEIGLGVFTQPLRTHSTNTPYRPADTVYRRSGYVPVFRIPYQPSRYLYHPSRYRISPTNTVSLQPIRQPTSPAIRSALVARIHFFRTLFSTEVPQRSAPQHRHRSPCHWTSAKTVLHRRHRMSNRSAAR